MPWIQFEPSGDRIWCEGGARLVDLFDEQAGSLLPLSCRAAHCGICRLRVEAGCEQFEPPASDERTTLAELGAGAGERLGCQLTLRSHAGTGTIVLRSRAT